MGLTISHINNYIAVLMALPASLGEFEQVVLLAILRLGESAYGVTIRAEIAEYTGRRPAPGALYTALDRLEVKGLVRSWLGDPTPQRGGRAKRYVKVTKKGVAAVVACQRSYQKLLDGLDLLGGQNWLTRRLQSG
jgi:PadR family transcriptional regulator, regulatory protein PadR